MAFLHRFFILATIVCSLILTTAAVASPDQASSCNNNKVFGVPKNTACIRGGAVTDCPSLQDVDDALIRAGGNTLVVIDFSATWCGPCKVIGPIFDELSEQTNNAVFLKVDVDENPDAAAKYAVSAMPTFVFVKGGEVVDRLMGANPTRLQELIRQHV